MDESPKKIEYAATHLKEIGYDCADLQMFIDPQSEYYGLSEKQLLAVRSALDGAGIEPYQAHGPWIYPPKNDTPQDRATWLLYAETAVRACAVLGCPYLVMHPVMPDGYLARQNAEEVEKINRKFFSRLLETAAREQVTVALENMPFRAELLATPREILSFVRSFDFPWFKVCFDTGHSLVRQTEPADAVREIGAQWLAVLHVHDNNGVSDQHEHPFRGKIDWKAFSAALREIGYNGVLSLETGVIGQKDTMPQPVLDALERSLYTIARTLAGSE